MQISELFSSQYQIKVKKQSTNFLVSTFKDAIGHNVEVSMQSVFDDIAHELKEKFGKPVRVYRFDFARNDEGDALTNDARDSAKIFSTVIQAVSDMVDYLKSKGEQPDVIAIVASIKEGSDRPGFYKKLISKLSGKYGYKVGADKEIIKLVSYEREGRVVQYISKDV